MRQTYNLKFYCRTAKASRKTGEAPIELSVNINGKRVFIQLPFKCTPEEFKKRKKQSQINEFLEEIKFKCRETEIKILKSGLSLTAENFKAVYNGNSAKSYTLKTLCDEYLSLLNKRVGVNLSYSAYKKYGDAVRCWCKFIDPNTDVATITPGKVEAAFYDLSKKYMPATANGIGVKMKTIFTYARDNNITQTNPFISIKYNKVVREIEYLPEEDQMKIRNKNFGIDRLNKVRDLAIFLMSSGLSYIDVINLRPEDIQFSEDGTCFIYKKRHKTNIYFTSVVLTPGVEILRRYDFNLPFYSNQKINSYLKEIQTILDIKQNLHCHLFRKTYATNLLNAGVRMETVSKCLGHSSTKITSSIYAKMKTSTVINEVKAVL